MDANIVQSSPMLIYFPSVEKLQGVDAISAHNCDCHGWYSIDIWSDIQNFDPIEVY